MDKANQLLLIEDDPVTSEVLCLMLGEDGWNISAMDSGEAALASLRHGAQLPNLVLCDQKLPGLHGAELADAIRSMYRAAKNQMPVLLAMSASACRVPEGYDALLLKPFSAHDVRLAFENGSLLSTPENSEQDATSMPVIDPEIFRNFQASMGSSRLRELYSFALSDATDRISRMRSAFTIGDQPALVREAHMLKGAAGMIGARRLAALAHDFEAPVLAHSETTGHFAAKMAMLCAALDDIERMLETQFPAQT